MLGAQLVFGPGIVILLSLRHAVSGVGIQAATGGVLFVVAPSEV
jgi:hypothetical protein